MANILDFNDNIGFERDQNNKILASYLKKSGVAPANIEKFMKLNFVRLQWQKLASLAEQFDTLNDEQRRAVIENVLSVENYGQIVAGAYDFISANASGATVDKDLLALYAAIYTVSKSAFDGEQEHISAIAGALCEMLEYDNEAPAARELVMYLNKSESFEKGYFNYDVDNYTFVFIGETK